MRDRRSPPLVTTIPSERARYSSESPAPPSLGMTRPARPSHTVLIADDETSCVDVASRLIRQMGLNVVTASNGAGCLEAVGQEPPDLILLDVEMPGLNGFEVCRRLKSADTTRLIPIVLVTALAGSEDRVRGIEAGADDFVTKPFNLLELEARVRSLVRLKQYTDELESAESVILGLALTVEARDAYTQGHCERLAAYAIALGGRLGMDEDDRHALYRGGYLHDLGKIGVPDHVLLKSGPLTPDEYELMKQHPVIGDRLCGKLRSMKPVRPIVRHHHERLDGSGYPDGLRGDEIPLLAQIVGVVDAYDAMTTNRPYRSAWPPARAYEDLRADVAKGRFESALVDTFIALGESGELARSISSRPPWRIGRDA